MLETLRKTMEEFLFLQDVFAGLLVDMIHFLPKLLAGLLVLIVFYLFYRIIRFIIVRSLKKSRYYGKSDQFNYQDREIYLSGICAYSGCRPDWN